MESPWMGTFRGHSPRIISTFWCICLGVYYYYYYHHHHHHHQSIMMLILTALTLAHTPVWSYFQHSIQNDLLKPKSKHVTHLRILTAPHPPRFLGPQGFASTPPWFLLDSPLCLFLPLSSHSASHAFHLLSLLLLAVLPPGGPRSGCQT